MEYHYDQWHGGTAACRRAASADGLAAVAPRPIVPQIVLHVAGNTRRFCVLSGAERCADDFLP
ncbi:hypothetical protein [Burkholderia seminalis]|uniref:hypothetical protein n=1 Tax=Burkholderia seminalis TaxID=488731 RepID=UPI001CF3DE07|nr:hypothetical protein [Burkholderia seminalis]MDN7850587.1 hypothetical protein [Burkholderia seminalis]